MPPMNGSSDPDPLADASAILPAVYDELRRRALLVMKKLPPGQTVQPTALVHDAFVNLVSRDQGPWKDEDHFLAVATLAIRSAVVDRIRAKQRLKRGGGAQRQSLHEDIPLALPDAAPETVIGVDAAMHDLTARDPRAAQVVTLRFFMGMTEPECARVLGVAERTVRRDWTFARLWLQKRLTEDGTEWNFHDE